VTVHAATRHMGCAASLLLVHRSVSPSLTLLTCWQTPSHVEPTWPRVYMHHVTLPQQQCLWSRWPLPPSLCCQELLLRIDENISKLVSGISACERILNTPIPLSYTR
jgi:hypothetical protein